MSNKSLKNLSKALGLAEGFIKGLAQGNKRGVNDFITMNNANACRAVAHFVGFESEQHARIAIKKNVDMLYTSAETLAARLQKLLPKYSKVKQAILEEGIRHLKGGNFGAYNKLMREHKSMKQFVRKFTKTVNKKLLDKFRSQPKTDAQTASKILKAAKSPKGYKLITSKAAIDKEIEARAKRYGSIGSLFWRAAKIQNPKIRPRLQNGQTLNKAKRKKHKLKDGSSFNAKVSKNMASATIKHKAEGINKKFNSKLIKTIKKQEEFWAKKAEKEMLAAKFLDKLLDV